MIRWLIQKVIQFFCRHPLELPIEYLHEFRPLIVRKRCVSCGRVRLVQTQLFIADEA